MGKATGDLTPEQRTAMAERERLIKQFAEKHGLKDAQERLRLTGEKLGMASMAESLRRIGGKLPKIETPSRQSRRLSNRSADAAVAAIAASAGSKWIACRTSDFL